MFKIRRDDIVHCIKGKDSGKTGKVIKVFPDEGKLIVEGLNVVKKHLRRRQQDQQSGIVNIEVPISSSNVMFFCRTCNRPVRIGYKLLSDKTKTRYCKRCNQTI